MQLHTRKVRGGFTLIELAVIIVVVGILAGVGTVSYSAYMKRADEKAAEADLRQAAAQLEKYKADHGDYPLAHTGSCENEGARYVCSPIAHDGNVTVDLPRSDADRVYSYGVSDSVSNPAGAPKCLSTDLMRSDRSLRLFLDSGVLEDGWCWAVPS